MNWPPFFRFKNSSALFDAVEVALKDSTEWKLRKRESDEMDASLAAGYIGKQSKVTDLAFVLYSSNDKPCEIQLTMHGLRWGSSTEWPTDAEYLAAERLTQCVFRAASGHLGEVLRLSRPKKRRRLVGKLMKLFAGFCAGSTDLWSGTKVQNLHPYDYERFYKFIGAAHDLRSPLDPEEVFAALRGAAFSVEAALGLTEHYRIGRRLLAINGRSAIWRGADWWNPWNSREDRKRAEERRQENDANEYRRVFGTDQPSSTR